MSITGIESTLTTNGTTDTSTSKSAASTKSLADNFDTFLTMLTVQLKNQDPLSPMDSNEFTSQLVQFANVEQQIAANSNLEKLISVNQVNQKAQAISYIGRTVEADTNQLPLQDGQASFSYTLGGDAKTCQIVIKDATGAIIRTISGDTETGRHEMTWDGRNANGEVVEDGAYSVEAIAVDGEGTAVETGTTVYGRVTDVAADDTNTLLGMGNVVTTLDKVLTVRETASAN